MQVLLVEPSGGSLPPGTAELIKDCGWGLATASDYRTALDLIGALPVDAIVMPQPTCKPPGDATERDFRNLTRLVDARQVATLLVADQPDVIDKSDDASPSPRSCVDVLDRSTPMAELRGRLTMIDRYHGHFRRMEQEVRNMERLGKRLNQHFRELDQEMRLAARLQRDFLPSLTHPIRNLQFSALFRPASWVSGDIFDVFRIDERHTGFYVADAVGHGVAASLLTMFIKRSFVSKHVQQDGYELLSPSQSMAILNDSLVEQALPDCQFVTACCGFINHDTLKLRFARGGHPYPMLFTDGIATELKSPGALLGLFKGEEFPTSEAQLRPGDKLLIYTDGVELAFHRGDDAPPDTLAYLDVFKATSELPVEEMLRAIEVRMEDESGSLNPRDDVTLVGVQVLDRSG